MKALLSLFLAIFWGGLAVLRAEEPNPAAISKLLIEPSFTRTSLARCDLTVGALECKERAMSGSYAIKIIPFSFKNDHGTLALAMTDKNTQKMSQGEPVEFTGMAISAKDGKKKAIKGKTIPEANDHGAVSFVVTTEDGDLFFNSTYKIVNK